MEETPRLCRRNESGVSDRSPMKKRILAMLLAGTMLFSQNGVVLAAGTSAEETSAAEIPEGEEAVQSGDAADGSEEAPALPEEASEVTAETDTADEAQAQPEEEALAEEEGAAPEDDVSEPAENTPAEEVLPPEPGLEETAEAEVPEERSSNSAPVAAEYAVIIRDDLKNGTLYTDSTGDCEWTCPVEVQGFGNAEYVLSVETDPVSPAGAVRIDEEQNLRIDGAALDQAGIDWISIWIGARVQGSLVCQSGLFRCDVKEVRIERHLNVGDAVLLPGWTYWIDRYRDCYLENGQYPEGGNADLIITDVALSDEDVVEIEHSDEYGWNLRAESFGECTVTVTYTDWDGTEGVTETFTLLVENDNYNVNIWTENGSYRALPGTAVTICAQAFHDHYDDGTGDYISYSDEEMAGITYNYSFEVERSDMGMDLSGSIALTPDLSDPKRAYLSFDDIPADCWWADVKVMVSIFEDGEEKVQNQTWIHMNRQYLELWPTLFDGDLEVGQELTITPEIREYPGSDGAEYDVLSASQVRFETETYDDNAYQITDNGDGTFTLLRKAGYRSDFRIIAYAKDENDQFREVDSRSFSLEQKNYRVDVREDEAAGRLFADGVWSAPVEVEGLDQGSYALTVWTDDHDGPADADADAGVWVDNEEGRLYIDGAYLKGEGISWIRIRFGLEINGYPLNDDFEYEYEIREPRFDRHFDFGDMDMLPGWTHWIDRQTSCYVENSQYPDGMDFDMTITDVAVSDENIVRIDNADEHGWDLRAAGMGDCIVTVTYTDWDGTEGVTETFTIHVGEDVYHVDIWSESGSDRVLPGKTITWIAQASHEQYLAADQEYHTCTEEEMAGITYHFSCEEVEADRGYDLSDCVEITPDPSDPHRANVRFVNIPGDCWWANARIKVTIFEDGEEKARSDRWIFMSRQYMELWPVQIGEAFDVGQEITITPEIRQYPGTDGAEYDVLPEGQTAYELEDYDSEALQITDNQDGTFTILRKREYGTSFKLIAYAETEDGSLEEVDSREYWLDGIEYGFWYDIEGNDTIYSDGSRTFGFIFQNLENVDFEIVPQVGTGYFDDDSGFEDSIPEGEGWSFDYDSCRITLDGETLSANGYDHISTAIQIVVCDEVLLQEWRDFQVREARFDTADFYEGPMFIGDREELHKTGRAYIECSDFPDGIRGTYTVTALTYEAEPDELDTRDPISLEEDGDCWRITALRNGFAQMHAVVEVQAEGRTYTREYDYPLLVGGWRYNLHLTTSTGSDKVQTGGQITLTARTWGEGYEWTTGEHYRIDTSGYEVRYEVHCTNVNPFLVDALYDGDEDAAMARGELWDYTEDPADRSVTVTSSENAYGLELEVEAVLIDPERGEECKRESMMLFVNPLLLEIILCEDDGETQIGWNEELVPGVDYTFTPAIRRSMAGANEPAIIPNPEDVTYAFEWNEGDGGEDPEHLLVTNCRGEKLHSGDQVTAADAPFTVRRMVPWDDHFNINAWWEDEEGYPQEAWIDYFFEEAEYSRGFIKNNDRQGGDGGYTWYYNNESINIVPDREALDQLAAQGYNVQTTVEMGIFNDVTMSAIPGYDPVAKGVFDETNGLRIEGADLRELIQCLEGGHASNSVRFCLRLYSELNGVTLVDRQLYVNIVKPRAEIVDIDERMGTGTEQVWEQGKAVLYVEDAGNDNGTDFGEYFDITITNISLDQAADQEFLAVSEENGTWKLKALKNADHEIPVTFTFTGAPEEYTTCHAGITVTGDIFRGELFGRGNAEDVSIDLLMGQTVTVVPDVTHIAYRETNGSVTTAETDLPDSDFHFDVFYDYYDPSMIEVDDASGTITPLRTGTTSLLVYVSVLDSQDQEVDSFYFYGDVYVSAFFPRLEVPADAVFYAEAGKTYTASQIAESIGAEFIMYSMRHPEGEQRTVTGYSLEDLQGAGQGMELSSAHTALTVSSQAQDGQAVLTLTGTDEEGFTADLQVTVILQSEPVKIISQPESVTAEAGTAVTFTVEARSLPGETMTYQWQYQGKNGSNWTNFANATGAAMTKTVQKSWDGWKVRCVVTGSSGYTVVSDTAVITVAAAGLTITKHPEAVTAAAGQSITFTVSASGTGLTYQWQYQGKNGTTWTNFANAAGASMTKTAQSSWNGWKVRCVVTDGSGNSAVSDTVTITIGSTGPVITKQPVSVTAVAGQSITFSVAASGSGLTYQWQYQGKTGTTWTNFANATGSSMTKTAQKSWDGWKVRCVVTDGSGNTAVSDTATITIGSTGPVITKQPVSVTAGAGQSITFSVTASGTGLTYQWQYQGKTGTTWTNFANATGASMTKTAQSSWNGWKVRCVVTDGSGNTAVSDTATITIGSTGPVITKQPVSVTAGAGQSITFSVTASGSGLTYQWQYQGKTGTTWTNFANATGSSMTKTAQSSWNGWKVRCVVKDGNGNSTVSDTASITISAANVTFTKQPESVTAAAGQSITFTVAASGSGLTYQWQYQGKTGTTWTNFANAAGASMTKTAQTSWNGWKVRCVVTDGSGNSAASDIATITIGASGITITKQPVSVTAGAGESITFSVTASGTGLTYQWQYQGKTSTNWTNFANATGASMTKTVQSSWNGWKIRCVITDGSGSTKNSDTAVITIQ